MSSNRLHQASATLTALINELGFGEIDLGALPGVCDHGPIVLDREATRSVGSRVNGSGLALRSITADVGDLNAPLDAAAQAARDRHVAALIELTREIRSGAIVLPCGGQRSKRSSTKRRTLI